jgi:hypothetical protein
MNRLIAGARRGRVGVLDRLAGTALDTDRQAQFQSALADVERAAKTGDDVARDMAEARLDAVLNKPALRAPPQPSRSLPPRR